MMRHFLLILTGLLLMDSSSVGAVSFATQRLREMSQYLHLTRLDTLRTGESYGYTYRGRPLVIRVNEWEEVEHIGLRLFGSNLRRQYPSPVYDFLERHLLERMAVPANSESGIRIFWDKVSFNVGSPETALQLDTTATFTDNYLDLKFYRVAWMVNEDVVLEVAFDMDWQLISGCNEIELEQNFIRSLGRIKAGKNSWPRTTTFPDEGDEFVTSGSFFITPFVQNNLYYTKEYGQWKLVRNMEHAAWAVSNIALTGGMGETTAMQLTIDRYGFKRDTLATTYRQFMQLCLDEGCVPYFGIKGRNGDAYDGTLFLVNYRGGYLHLLSTHIPTSIVDHPTSAAIKGRLYTYIPLFNVSDKTINPQSYKSKTHK